MKFLSVIAMAAAVSAAAVAPRDGGDWNNWGQQCSTVTVTNTVTSTATVTAYKTNTVTATVTSVVTSVSTKTNTATVTATVTQECNQWGGWNPKE